MTDCPTTRDWLLEVDPEELERVRAKSLGDSGDLEQDGGERAAHLAECLECGALANEILEADGVLRDGLDSLEPSLDVETALAKAREVHQAAKLRRTTLRRRGWQAALPLAAAALGALIVLGRPSPARIADLDPATVRAATGLGLEGPMPLVRATSQDRLAVLPTENPNITVIWFME